LTPWDHVNFGSLKNVCLLPNCPFPEHQIATGISTRGSYEFSASHSVHRFFKNWHHFYLGPSKKFQKLRDAKKHVLIIITWLFTVEVNTLTTITTNISYFTEEQTSPDRQTRVQQRFPLDTTLDFTIPLHCPPTLWLRNLIQTLHRDTMLHKDKTYTHHTHRLLLLDNRTLVHETQWTYSLITARDDRALNDSPFSSI